MHTQQRHEIGIAEFLTPARRERWRALMKKRGGAGRERALQLLPHGLELSPGFATRIPAQHADRERAWLLDELVRRGSPDRVVIIRDDEEPEDALLPLHDAVNEVCGMSEGAIISCIPGVLAYYEGADPGERYVLHRGC